MSALRKSRSRKNQYLLFTLITVATTKIRITTDDKYCNLVVHIFATNNRFFAAAGWLVTFIAIILHKNLVIMRYYLLFWPWKATRNLALWIIGSDSYFAFLDVINSRLIYDFLMLSNICYTIHISSLFIFEQIVVIIDLFSWFITIVTIANFIAKSISSCTIARFRMSPVFLVQFSWAPSVQTFTTKEQF